MSSALEAYLLAKAERDLSPLWWYVPSRWCYGVFLPKEGSDD